MLTMDINDLTTTLPTVLQQIREQGETVNITMGGEVVARVVPVAAAVPMTRSTLEVLADMERLAQEISPLWPADVSTQDIMNDIRRDL